MEFWHMEAPYANLNRPLIHRTDGQMPWKDLGSCWNAMASLNQHFEPGVRRLHHKWWQKVQNQTVNNYVTDTVEKMSVFYKIDSISRTI